MSDESFALADSLGTCTSNSTATRTPESAVVPYVAGVVVLMTGAQVVHTRVFLAPTVIVASVSTPIDTTSVTRVARESARVVLRPPLRSIQIPLEEVISISAVEPGARLETDVVAECSSIL